MTDNATALVETLRTEERLLGELSSALAEQRAGIARDDASAIEVATHRVSRAVMTLDEARRRREQLTQLLTGGESTALDRLSAMDASIEGLDDARASLRTAATASVRDLALNQVILRGALKAGDSYLQSLFASVSEPAPVYNMATTRAPRVSASGVVVNRRA